MAKEKKEEEKMDVLKYDPKMFEPHVTLINEMFDYWNMASKRLYDISEEEKTKLFNSIKEKDPSFTEIIEVENILDLINIKAQHHDNMIEPMKITSTKDWRAFYPVESLCQFIDIDKADLHERHVQLLQYDDLVNTQIYDLFKNMNNKDLTRLEAGEKLGSIKKIKDTLYTQHPDDLGSREFLVSIFKEPMILGYLTCRVFPEHVEFPMEREMLEVIKNWDTWLEVWTDDNKTRRTAYLCKKPYKISKRTELGIDIEVWHWVGLDLCWMSLAGSGTKISMPSEMGVLPPEEWQSEWYFLFENVEEQKFFLTLYGLDRLKKYGDVIEPARPGDPNEYELIDLAKILKNDNVKYAPHLWMRNPSTGIYHLNGVSEECKTIEQAVLWMDKGYKPEVRT